MDIVRSRIYSYLSEVGVAQTKAQFALHIKKLRFALHAKFEIFALLEFALYIFYKSAKAQIFAPRVTKYLRLAQNEIVFYHFQRVINYK